MSDRADLEDSSSSSKTTSPVATPSNSSEGKRPSYPAAAFTPPEKKGKSDGSDSDTADAKEQQQQQQQQQQSLISAAFTIPRSALSSSSESGSNSNSSLGSAAAVSEDDSDNVSASLPPTWKPSRLLDGDVNSGTFTRVHLRVKCESRFGESLHCSGSSFVMGHFNPNESTTLVTTPEQYPYWTTVKPVILPRGVPHQYMFALFAGGVFSSWEPIECERVMVPDGREMTVVEEFGVYDSDLQLVKTGAMNERSTVYERRKELPRSDFETKEEKMESAESSLGGVTSSTSGPPSLARTASQYFRQAKIQSRYKRYMPANYRPDPAATLFLVCYHLPVKLTKSPVDGSWSAAWNRDSLISRSEGSIAESMHVRWVGCVTHQARDDLEDLSDDDKREITDVLSKMDCIPVFIDRELAADHYQGYCKNKLWPMFHNVDILDIYTSVWDRNEVIQWKEERNNGKWWEAYQQVNLLLATCVGELCGKNDTVWVHDYHLLLFPSYLARLCKEKDTKRPSMVFFLHVPFPTSEIFRELSHGPQLLEGVLGVDVVGFHSFDHARHFLNACKRFLGLSYQSRRGGNLGVDYRGRNVVITISHVGIENRAIRDVIADPEVHEAARKLREKHAGKVLIGGIDVCQRLSGIPLKLLAFEQFFSTCTSWKDRLVLVQRCHLTNSREGDQEYSSGEIRQLVKRISEQHGADVIDYEESTSALSLRERIIMWLACDILMVTSIREGLNLKPLEYVFAKGVTPGNRAGVVILSEFSACCCVLNGALRVNPWNITEVVNSLDHALTMSEEERMGRRARDLPYITNQPAANWTKQVLSVLQEATENEEGDEEYTDMEYMDTEIGRSHVLRIGQRSDFKQLNIQRVLEAYKSSKRRVFLLDYGGTIIARENMSMYVKKDFTAVTGKLPSPRMIDALTMLTSDPRNTVFVVSGLSQLNLTSAVGHIRGLGLAAENGALYSWAKSIRARVEDPGSAPEQDGSSNADDDRHWHHHNFKFDWRAVREAVDPILKVYCTRTNGSVLRYMEQSIAWNFRSTDPEWGLLQANSLQSDLEDVLRDHPVNIIRKKGLLEIVPEGLNKGVVARQILTQDAGINRGHPDFLFCIGDDTTDESMFKSIYDYYAERSEESVHGRALVRSGSGFMDTPPGSNEGSLHHLFTCTVGKKPSHAHLYLNNVDDVEELLFTLGKRADEEPPAHQRARAAVVDQEPAADDLRQDAAHALPRRDVQQHGRDPRGHGRERPGLCVLHHEQPLYARAAPRRAHDRVLLQSDPQDRAARDVRERDGDAVCGITIFARCIDVQSQVLISTLRGHRYPARSASFQKSGKLALTASQDAVILWDTKDWSRFRVLNAGPGVEEATFVSRGDLVAVCFQDDTIMMWELESLALRYRFSLPEHEQSPGLRKITVSDDYKVLVASGRSPFIYVWDFEAQTIIRIIELPVPIKEVITHAFLPGHDSMLSILEDNGGLFFLDVAAKKPKIKLEISKRDKKFTAFDIECHGRYLAACTDDGYLLLYDMEIARETALRAQAERRKEGLFELDENARLSTRSGLLSTQEMFVNDLKDKPKQSHPVPSKLIDSLFGATYARRNDVNSSKEVFPARDTYQTEATRGDNPADIQHIQVSKAVRTHQHNVSGKVRFKPTAQNPLTAAPGMLNAQEIEVNQKRLEASLKCNGVYPKKYRLLVWRFLLRLPKNEEAFRALVTKGKHPAFVRLHEQYPLQNSRLFRRLHRVLSAIAYWCPAFGEVSYLPEVVYPFVKMFCENDLAAFEASLSVLLYWGGDFLRSLPYPPVAILNTLDKELQRRDPQLHSHLVQHQINAEMYGWSLLKTIFTEVLSEDEWMTLWDHLFTYADKPQLLYVAVLAYLSYFRTALLGASDRFSIEQFFHQQNAIKIQSFLQLVANISQSVDLKSFESCGLETQNGGEEDASRTASYWPLSRGQYPAFGSYPKFVVDFQISERNRIALEENEMVQKKKLLEEVEAQCAKLKAEHEAWLEQKNMVLAAEEQRRTEAVAAEKYRILNLKSLDHQTRKRRLERLDAMEKYAHQTLDETAKMFQAEYERLEATLAMQRERTDFEISSRQQEEELQRVEFEAEKRVMDIHKQREMEERLQKLRTEFVTRVKQQEMQDLLKFESWKREDEDRKREAKMKLQRREELAVLHQEKTIRQKLETEFLDQLLEKEKELLALETERKSRQKEQRAFDALDHEIDLRKAELEAMKGHQRDGETERPRTAYESADVEVDSASRHVSDDRREEEEMTTRRPSGQQKPFAQHENTTRPLPGRTQCHEWSTPAEARKHSSLHSQRRERTKTRDKEGASHAEKLAQLNQSLLHSGSSESSFTSAVLERTMEEMTLLEKALRNISSSSSASSSRSSMSSRHQRIGHTVNQRDQQHSSTPLQHSMSLEANRFRDDRANVPREPSSNNYSHAAPIQQQSSAHQSQILPPDHSERRRPSVLARPGSDHANDSGDDEEDASEDSNTSHTLQRPIAELERELGIRFDDFSDEEEEKEGDRSDEEDSVDEDGGDDAIEDDRARLLERAKRLLEEENFSDDDE